MNENIDGEPLRFLGWLLLLSVGLIGGEVLVGLPWTEIAPFDLGPVLVGLGLLLIVCGILSVTTLRVGPRLPRWYRWIVGVGAGLLLPFKLGLTHPGSMMASFALTALIVVAVSRALGDGEDPRVLAVVFLLLFVLGGGWFEGVAGSVLGEMTLGTVAALVLGVFLAAFYRLSGKVAGLVDQRAWVVSGVLIGLFLAGMFAWGTMKPRAEVPSYFSGSVPEVQGPENTPVNELPNVIMISVDTLRLDRVPPRADEELELPALRSLMRDSVRFSRVFSSSSWTLPSHASLFTGLPPMGHGAVNPEGSRIYASVPSYAQMLQKLGYQTAAFTDGGFVSDQFGFGRGFGRYQSSYGFTKRRTSTLEPVIQALGRRLLDAIAPSRPDPPEGTEPGEYNYLWQNLRAARGWLSGERDPDRPFFMFLHTYQAHDYLALYPRSMRQLRHQRPKLARAASSMGGLESGFPGLDAAQKQRLRRRLKTAADSPVRSSFVSLATLRPRVWSVLKFWVLGLGDDEWEAFLKLSPDGRKKVLFRAATGARRWGVPALPNLHTDYRRTPYMEWLQSTFDIKPETVRRINNRNRLKIKGLEWLYDDLVEDVDQSLGDFLDLLRENRIYDETLIVFLSDHGEGFSWSPLLVDHGFRTFLDGRGQLNDALTHVPVWIKPPKAPSSGGVCQELFQLRDVFPIVFRELDVQLPESAQSGELTRPREGTKLCPRSRRKFVKGSVTQRKPWLEFRPRFYVQGDDHRLEVQRDPVEMRIFWELRDDRPDRRVPSDDVPKASRERLREAMEEYLGQFDEHPDPYRRQNWEADEELEEELRGLGYI